MISTLSMILALGLLIRVKRGYARLALDVEAINTLAQK
jgi:hypothetical protein